MLICDKKCIEKKKSSIFLLQEKHHRRIGVTENYTLAGLYPNTLYYVWLAARSQRGEGATTIPYEVRTKQYGKQRRKTIDSQAARSATQRDISIYSTIRANIIFTKSVR